MQSAIYADGIETVRKLEKDGLISEDDRHVQEIKVQKLTDEFVKKIDNALSHKERDNAGVTSALFKI